MEQTSRPSQVLNKRETQFHYLSRNESRMESLKLAWACSYGELAENRSLVSKEDHAKVYSENLITSRLSSSHSASI